MKILNNKRAFSLVEVILVIAAIAILASIVIIAINPQKQLAETRNAKRSSDINNIMKAVYQYSIDNNGNFPEGINESWQMIGSSSESCSFSLNQNLQVSNTENFFADSAQSDFNNGSFSNTKWDEINSVISLNETGLINYYGEYVSQVFDANSESDWHEFSWVPAQPYGHELPDNEGVESLYPSGNINMNGNVLLMHLNEVSGASMFLDSSGNNNAVCANNSCPTSISNGKFNRALNFDGASNGLRVNHSSSLNVNQITLMSWVKWNINPSAGKGWASIINKNTDSQYRLQHNYNNTAFEFGIRTSSGGRFISSNTQPVAGRWYHVVATYDGSILKIFVDGRLENSFNHSGNINHLTGDLFIGRSTNTGREFNGVLDEVSIWNKALSEQEIIDIYKRGILKLKFQVRTCLDSSCSGENFVGPDNNPLSYFTDSDDSQLPLFNLSNLPDSQYFQYKAILETLDSNYSPSFGSASISSLNDEDSNGESVGDMQESSENCLDLSAELIPEYIVEIPRDPSSDSENKSYYFIRKNFNGRLMISAPLAGNDETILITK